MAGQIVLTTDQILNLCEFAGIKVNREKSVFFTDADQLETPYAISQNEHGSVAWLEEYPGEGCYPLSDHTDCQRLRVSGQPPKHI